MSAPPIRVLVVDDSAYNRRVLKEMLESSPRVQVVASARSGDDALKKLYEHRPDVITLDLEMPGMDGFTFLRLVMQSNPLPIIVVSSRTEDRAIFRALELGAADFIAKPSARISRAIERIQAELVYKVENIGQVRMDKVLQVEAPASVEPAPVDEEAAKKAAVDCVVIGASTGGPSALYTVLSGLQPTFAIPIAIAQHMPPGFTRPFAERLARRIGRDVREARDGERMKAGSIYLAPGGTHLEIDRQQSGPRLYLIEPDVGDRFVPSVDRLFKSAARALGERVHGVVLTGMGSDGLAGSAMIRKAGGQVIVESEETAIVYGMPREVAEAGLAAHVLPLQEIAEQLCEDALKGPSKRSAGRRRA